MPAASRHKIKFGPWTKGLRTNFEKRPNNTAFGVGPDELAKCYNFEVMNNGVLHPRRGVKHLYNPGNPWSAPVATASILSMDVIGSVYDNLSGSPAAPTTWAYAQIRYTGAYAPNPGGSDVICTKDGTNWVTAYAPAANNFYLCDMAQYNGYVYFLRSTQAIDTGSGGYRFADTNIGALTVLTAVPNMPKGSQCFVFKDRLWVVDGDAETIYYSKATDPTVWASPDGGSFKVNPGRRDKILQVIVTQEALYIFKNRGIYVFTFYSDPGADGQLRLLSDTNGGYPYLWNNEVYVVTTSNQVMRLAGQQLVDIAPQMLFIAQAQQANTQPYRAHVVGRRLFVSFYLNGVPNNKLYYEMNLDTGAWNQVSFKDTMDPLGWKSTPFQSNTAAGVIVQGTEHSSQLYTIDADPLNAKVYDLDPSNNQWLPWYQVSTGIVEAPEYGMMAVTRVRSNDRFDYVQRDTDIVDLYMKVHAAEDVGPPFWRIEYSQLQATGFIPVKTHERDSVHVSKFRSTYRIRTRQLQFGVESFNFTTPTPGTPDSAQALTYLSDFTADVVSRGEWSWM